jgi:hypothetical protein
MKLKNIIWLCVFLPLVAFVAKPEITQDIEIVKPSFEQEITRIFGNKAEIALAVFEHESNGGDIDAINYNCRYDGKSTFCKKGDKSKAWSVDCGVAQINVKGQVCPPQLLTKEGSIPYIEKIYKEQGLRAWVSFNNKKYKVYL